MLQHLNASTISRFGRLLHRFDASASSVCLLSADRHFGYAFGRNPVVIAPFENMVILDLLSEDNACVSLYLDKPVELRPGVRFALRPIDSCCSVYCQSDTPLTFLSQKDAPAVSAAPPALTICRLCTVFFQEHAEGFFFAGERHRAYEMVYVTHGVLHTVIDGRDFALRSGEVVFIPADQWHIQFGEKDTAVSFWVASFFCSVPLPESVFRQVFPRQQRTARLVEDLLQELKRKDAFQADMLLALLQSLMVYYVRLSAESNRQAPRVPANICSEEQIISQATEYISSNIHQKITVQQLAKACHVSSSHLTLLFIRHLGISPAAYALRVRLEESKTLIRIGEANMTQIANTLGFSSPQHFSTAFKRLYGISPSDYAKNL